MQRTYSLEKTDAGKDWRQEEKRMTEDEMVGWHYQLSGHEFEQAPRVDDGQGSLLSPWGRRVRHDWVTELNWNTGLGMKKRVWCSFSILHFISYFIFLMLRMFYFSNQKIKVLSIQLWQKKEKLSLARKICF